MPPKKEIQVNAPLSKMQREFYKAMLSQNVELLTAASQKKSTAGLAKNLQGLMYVFGMPHRDCFRLYALVGVPKGPSQSRS